MPALTEQVDFSIIRYANCWEDADVLLEALGPEKNNRFLSIGSAGDNSFSLLTRDPELVVAVDVNQVQLFLIELKKVCIQNLAYEETLSFLGFTASTSREQTFLKIKPKLGQASRSYWEKHVELLRKGIVHQGRFEKYFQLFTKKILPWIHSEKTTEDLLSVKTAPQQQTFYNEHWNTWRWKLFFRLFFSRAVMGKFGRDPQFLKEVNLSVGKFIFNQAEKHLVSEASQANFILRYCLTGSFGNTLPHYLLPGNYPLVKKNIAQLKLKKGYAQDAIRESGPFDRMNLSDIFEYMDEQTFIETGNQLLAGLAPQGRLAYWNLMVPRRLSAKFPDSLEFQQQLSSNLTKKDKGFFYKEVIVEQRA